VPRDRFDVERLDEEDPFEIDGQFVHLAKHDGMDQCDISEVWMDNPLFYEARDDGPADWLMVGEVPGEILLVPLAPGSRPGKARPIGIYRAGGYLDKRYRHDAR
jgi:hypothetical protein